MFKKFNGTPLHLVRLLTMQSTEHQVDGPSTDLARQFLGFGDTEALAARAPEVEMNSHWASVAYQPEYAREQDVRDGYQKGDREGLIRPVGPGCLRRARDAHEGIAPGRGRVGVGGLAVVPLSDAVAGPTGGWPGFGRAAAVEGADVVVDLTNSPPWEDDDVLAFFRESSPTSSPPRRRRASDTT